MEEPGTDLHRWVHEELPEPTVDPRLTVLSALDSSIQCLTQIRRFVLDPRPTTTPMVIAALMRSSLLSGARPIFILGPLEPEKRRTNILLVLKTRNPIRSAFSPAAFWRGSHLS